MFKEYKATLEKTEYNIPKLRSKYYGQRDYARAYGQDYEGRLHQVGFEIEKNLLVKIILKEN